MYSFCLIYIGVSSMLLYYRFFHPRGSGAILLFKKKNGDDRHRLHPKDRAPRTHLSEGAEISRRSRSPTPVKKNSPHKHCGSSPLAYPITTRSLTPCKYSPLKSDGELPYDRYGMRRRSPYRTQSEACIDSFSNDCVITPAPRLGRVHSEQLYSQKKTPPSTTGAFEFSGFATDLVKQFDKKMDQACASAIASNNSYGSYGFDVEAQSSHLQSSRSQSQQSSSKSEHQVIVHAASSQPDMRRALTTVDEKDQSSVLLEPLPNALDETQKIKNAYEVKQMYHTMLNDGQGRPEPSSKRQLMFGQSDRSPSPLQKRLPTPMCPYHQKISARKSNSLPSPRRQAVRKSNSFSLPRQQIKQNTWQVCEIDIEPKNNQQKIQNERRLSGTPPKAEPPNASTQPQERLKIPQDTSKVEREMLKTGEKRKFSFREKVPVASLKAMRFTPKPDGDPSSPIWKLRNLNARLWQPKTVDIYNPKLNNSPGKPMLVTQKRFGPQPKQVEQPFSFNSEDSPDFGNIYTIFGPPNRLKNVNSENKSTRPATFISNVPTTKPATSISNVPPTPNNSYGSSSNTRPTNTNPRTSFEFSTRQNQVNTTNIRKKSPLNNSNGRKPENIYATINEEESENHDYSDLGSCIYGSGGSRGSGEGSGGKKRKISPRADLPQQDLKSSQQSPHPVTPLTPSKSYRLADRDLQNSPHRHISSSSSSGRTKSRLNVAHSQNLNVADTPTQFEQVKVTPQDATPYTQINSKSNLSTNMEEPIANSNTANVVSNQVKYLPNKTSKQSQQLNPETIATTSKEKETSSCKISERIQRSSELSARNERGPAQQSTTDRILGATSASDGKNSKKPLIGKQSPRSNSMPTINDPETVNTSATKTESNSKETNPRNDKSSTKKSSSSVSLLEKQSGKSQSLPEIANTTQVKKGMKPKSHSDNRENFKQPSTAGGRKPLAQLRNGSTNSLSTKSNKPSSGEKHSLLDNTSVSRKSKLSPPIEKPIPLMQSTPALPDCRKLLRFESTGAKPKNRPLDTELVKDIGRTKTKKPLSPVENGGDENKGTSVTANPSKSRTDEMRITQPGAPSLMESRLRDRVGRYDPDIVRSGKENQHLAIARIFDVLSPTDSFVSSLAFQNTIERRAPPKKPPRTSIGKIPNNTVSDTVAKFSVNGTDL